MSASNERFRRRSVNAKRLKRARNRWRGNDPLTGLAKPPPHFLELDRRIALVGSEENAFALMFDLDRFRSRSMTCAVTPSAINCQVIGARS